MEIVSFPGGLQKLYRRKGWEEAPVAGQGFVREANVMSVVRCGVGCEDNRR